MASKTKVFKRVPKKNKGAAISVLNEVKSDGSPAGVKKVIEGLKKKRVKYFEVHDFEAGRKNCFQLSISGQIYAEKNLPIAEK